MAQQYWLMKCEPEAYSISDLARDGKTSWEGVRNFQARNFIRQMRKGDLVLFYASNATPSGVTGVAEIAGDAYPDPFALQKGHKYYDPDSSPSNQRWYSVDLGFVEQFPDVVSLAALKANDSLRDMVVVQKGSRLSVQPVTSEEFRIVLSMGRSSSSR